jgi:hypothetical protein
MLRKTLPDSNIIKILSEEIIVFGIPFAKTIKDGGLNKTAFDYFKNIIPSDYDNTKASSIYGQYDMERTTSPLIKEVCGILGADECTNTAYYTKNGCIEWHTNSDIPGTRVYIIFTTIPGIFRYKNPVTGEIIDDSDNIGWTQREFKVEKENPLWHCVYSPAPRFAYGFNIR